MALRRQWAGIVGRGDGTGPRCAPPSRLLKKSAFQAFFVLLVPLIPDPQNTIFGIVDDLEELLSRCLFEQGPKSFFNSLLVEVKG